jgi:hypothetical protein
VQSTWQHTSSYHNAAKDITARFKSIRHGIKKWNSQISNLGKIVENYNFVLGLEDQRPLSNTEANSLERHRYSREDIVWLEIGLSTEGTRRIRHNESGIHE